MSVCEFTTYVTDADGQEWEVRVEVTEYQPGTPEWKGPRMEDYDPGNPPDLSYDVYYPDGTRADDLIESLPLIEKIRLEDEVLKRAHEEWEACFGKENNNEQ